MKSVTLFCFAATLFFGASATACLADDNANIVGHWLLTSGVSKGVAMPADKVKTVYVLLLANGKYTVSVGGEIEHWTYTVDSNKTPKQMTLEGQSGRIDGKKMLAIYELDNKTLKVCYDLSGKAFPQKFESKSGTDFFLATYKLILKRGRGRSRIVPNGQGKGQ